MSKSYSWDDSRNCEKCNKEYFPHHKKQRFCSADCYHKTYHRKN